MCMCYYPESGCRRCRKYCVYCEGEETNWACTCAVSPRSQQDGAIAVEIESDTKRRRVQEFQDAVQNVQEFFEMALALQGIEMGPKEKRQCEKIGRQSLLKAFSDMSGVIRKRRKADEMQAADMAEQKRLLGLLSKENDQQARVELVKLVMRGSGFSCKDAIL